MKYFLKIRERAVRLVPENQKEYKSQWAAMVIHSIEDWLCTETLRTWVRQSETG